MRQIVLLFAGAAAGLLFAACDAPPAAHPAREVVDGWGVRVTVTPHRLGRIAFGVDRLVRAEPNEAHAWVRHDLVLHNGGDRKVTFADTRRSAFARGPGRRRVLVADAGCGYAIDRRGAAAIAGVCQASLDLISIEPHASVRRQVTLFKGLGGMERLRAGTYVFRRAVRFRVGERAPDVGEGRRVVLTLAYRVADDPLPR
jgi:hypothetical protein